MVNKKKTTKKQTSPEWNFLQPPIVCSRCLITLFQNKCPFYFACPFFKEYLNLEVRINKMANEHSVNPHPIPSWLTSRIQSRIFHKTFGVLSLSKHFLEFSVKAVYATMAGKFFIFMVFRLLVFRCVCKSKKNEFRDFYSCPPKQNSPLRTFYHPQAALVSHFKKRFFIHATISL